MNARANTAIGRDFFSNNGRYLIDPSCKAKDMAADASCMLEGVIQTIDAIIDGLSDKGSQMSANVQRQVPSMLFGLMYQLQMVQNITEALESAQFDEPSIDL